LKSSYGGIACFLLLQTVPVERAAAVASVVNEMMPRSIDRRITIAYASPRLGDWSHRRPASIELCNLPGGSNAHLGMDNLGASEQLCSFTPSYARFTAHNHAVAAQPSGCRLVQDTLSPHKMHNLLVVFKALRRLASPFDALPAIRKSTNVQ
jgi:hypothetical protein